MPRRIGKSTECAVRAKKFATCISYAKHIYTIVVWLIGISIDLGSLAVLFVIFCGTGIISNRKMVSLTEVPNPVTPKSVFYFVPNIIGYARIITLLLSFVTMANYPIITMGFLYSASCLLDAFDGYYARKFNQSTQFGAVLDMVTDRCSTCSLIVYLSVLYPKYFIAWQILISLDLASHYVHMYAQIVSGSTSHKKMREGTNWLLKLYYENRIFLFLVCAFNEIFYIALYLLHFDIFYFPGTNINLAYWITIVCTPVWFFKQFCNVIQMFNACEILAQLDATRMNNLRKSN